MANLNYSALAKEKKRSLLLAAVSQSKTMIFFISLLILSLIGSIVVTRTSSLWLISAIAAFILLVLTYVKFIRLLGNIGPAQVNLFSQQNGFAYTPKIDSNNYQTATARLYRKGAVARTGDIFNEIKGTINGLEFRAGLYSASMFRGRIGSSTDVGGYIAIILLRNNVPDLVVATKNNTKFAKNIADIKGLSEIDTAPDLVAFSADVHKNDAGNFVTKVTRALDDRFALEINNGKALLFYNFGGSHWWNMNLNYAAIMHIIENLSAIL